MSAHPEPWRSLTGLIKKLDERIRRLENRPVFYGSGLEVVDDGQIMQDGAVTIPANGLLLVDGGDVIMLDENMTELFRVGIMERGDRGIRVRRTDGSVAFEVRDTLGFGVQSIAMRDAEGSLIAGTGLFPNGLGAPYQAINWVPTDYLSGAPAQSTSSDVFVATHEHRGFKQNNVVWPQFMVRCSDASTAGEVQLFSVTTGLPLDNGGGVPMVITIPAGTTTFTLAEFSEYLVLPGSFGTPVNYQIQVRRTAGTGSVTVAPVRSVGVRDQLSAH